MARKIQQEYWIKDKGTGEFKRVSDKLQSQLNDIERTSKRTTDSMSSSWKKLIGVIGAAGIGAAFISLTRTTLNYADQLGKLNTRLGINVQQMDKLRQIADLSDVSFNTLATAMQRMTRRIAEAAQGTGVAVSALEQLGVSVSDLQGLTPDEQFLKLAEALSQVDDKGQQVALAFKLFDTEGVKVLQMLPGLANGLQDVTSNMSLEKARAAEEFNDQLTLLREVGTQLAMRILPGLNKGLKFLIDHLTEIQIVIGTLISLKVSGWLAGMAGGVGLLAGAFKALTFEVEVFKNAILVDTVTGKVTEKVIKTTVAVDALTFAFHGLNAVLGLSIFTYFLVQIAEAITKTKELKDEVQDVSEYIMIMGAVEGGQTPDQVAESIRKSREKREKAINDDISSLKEAARLYFKSIANLNKSRIIENKPLPLGTSFNYKDSWMKDYSDERYAAQSRALGLLIQQEKDAAEARRQIYIKDAMNFKNTEIEKMKGLKEASIRAEEIIKERIKALEEASRSFSDFLSTSITDGFMAFLDGTKSAEEAFRQMAISILNDLSRMIIKMAIFNALQGAFGGVGGGIAGAVGSIFGFQHGGHIKKGEPVMVGEAGPEIFMPDGSGTIMSNPNSKRFMGGDEASNVTVNIAINRPIGSDTEAKRTGKLIQNELKTFFDKRLAYQSKPGGILRPQPVMR
jgi:hypothetical protein